MKKQKPPRKLPRAERIKRAVHYRVSVDNSRTKAKARETYLRSLMGLSGPERSK
jgi:hypothetical protein